MLMANAISEVAAKTPGTKIVQLLLVAMNLAVINYFLMYSQ